MPEKFTPGLAFRFLTPGYDIAASLLGLGSPFVRRLIQVLQMAGIKGDERVLDIGCGTGTFITGLKKIYPGMKITGIDPDANMLQKARDKLSSARLNAELAHGFIQELPFPDASFDLVTSTLVFHHLPAEGKQQGIAETSRVLAPAGWFLLADFGKPETTFMKVLLNVSSTLDGRANMRANLRGRLPGMLEEAHFLVKDIKPRHRGVQFLLARKRADQV